MEYLIRIISILILSLLLSSCIKSMAHQIQEASKTADKDYPEAIPYDSKFKKPFIVQLNHYKSVQTRPHQRNDIAFVLATSGGGYRAANLTLGVLMGLEKIKTNALKGNLLQEVDYFSTISGGGYPIAYYLAKLHNYLEAHHDTSAFSLQQHVNAMLARDYEKSKTPNPLRADLTSYLYADRKQGMKVEKILNDTMLHTASGGLKADDIFIPANSNAPVELPYWIPISTIYSDAGIFQFAPDILAHYQVDNFYHNNKDYYFSNIEQPNYAYHIPMSVGLMASMSVPFVLPSTTLGSTACGRECYLQLFDGAIADNLGVFTALDLLLQDKSRIKILMIIDSGKVDDKPFSVLKKPPEDMPLVVRSSTIAIDSMRTYLKDNLDFVAHALLCKRDTDNVVIIYLDLKDYPYTQRIDSDLKMSLQHQQLLIEVGQELIMKNKKLHTMLSELSSGKLTLGHC